MHKVLSNNNCSLRTHGIGPLLLRQLTSQVVRALLQRQGMALLNSYTYYPRLPQTLHIWFARLVVVVVTLTCLATT